jgi:hypothetical protein
MTSAEYQQLVEFLGRQFTEIGRRFTEMGRRFDEVDLRLTDLRQEILGHFDAIYHRFERLEQEYHAIT